MPAEDVLKGRIDELEDRADALERRADEQDQTLYGDERRGRQGFLQELAELRGQIKEVKAIAETIAQERRDEAAERRGLQRAVNWTGVTNLATLAGLAWVLYNLYQIVGA